MVHRRLVFRADAHGLLGGQGVANKELGAALAPVPTGGPVRFCPRAHRLEEGFECEPAALRGGSVEADKGYVAYLVVEVEVFDRRHRAPSSALRCRTPQIGATLCGADDVLGLRIEQEVLRVRSA